MMADTIAVETRTTTAPHLLLGAARLYVIVMFPVLLVIIAVRLLMTPAYLYFEYTRPDFPIDRYGFTTADRLSHAPYAVDYLVNNEPVEYLGDLTFPNGTALYNDRELRHMRDVQAVVQIAFVAGIVAGVVFIGAALALARAGLLRRALMNGALLTLALIFSIVILVVFNWDYFFTLFHRLFFEDGTWQFYFSDTLIRLFPEQFWFDAALLIGGFAVVVSLITLGGTLALGRRR